MSDSNSDPRMKLFYAFFWKSIIKPQRGLNVVVYAVRGAMLGFLIALLNSGSMFMCNMVPGAATPDAGPIEAVLRARVFMCIGDKGLLALPFIILGTLIPWVWFVGLPYAYTLVPTFTVVGAIIGGIIDIINSYRAKSRPV